MILCFLFVFVVVKCREYAIVVDAGSTSSKLKVYYWDDLKNIVQVDGGFKKMEALTKYLTQSDKNLTRDMTEFVNQALPYIDGQKSCPFYLGATAGLRLLKVDDAEKLITKVRKVIKENYHFKYSDRQIRVLSGEEEGIFGWIMVQYVRKDFQFENTAGALDMGGASTQISFIPHEQQILADKETIKCFGTIVDTFSHSFLRYGLNEALYQINQNLVYESAKKNDDDSNKDIENPCLFKGYRREIKGIMYTGTSDVFRCREEVKKILRLGSYCVYPEGTCSVDSDYVPQVPQPKDQTFYAFSGFEYMPSGLKLPSEGLKLSLLNSTAWNFCHHNYSYALKNSGMEEEFVWNQCFNVLYGIELLINGYGFSKEAEGQLIFSGKVGGMDVGWALGSLVYEQMFLESQEEEKKVKEKDYVLTPMIIGFSFLALAILFIVVLIIIVFLQCCVIITSLSFVCFKSRQSNASAERVYERVNGGDLS